MTLALPTYPTLDADRARELCEEYHARRTRWSNWRTNVSMIDLLASGKWGQVFPDDVSSDDLPLVENLFRMSIEDGGRLFGSQIPTERVDAAGLNDPKTEVRERILNGYTYGSNLYVTQESPGQDMIASGITGIKVWPRKNRDGKSFPRFEHVDPRYILPEDRWAPDRPSDCVMLSYTMPIARLRREFGDEVVDLVMADIRAKRDRMRVGSNYYAERIGKPGYDNDGMPKELRVLDYWSSEKISRLLLYTERSDTVTSWDPKDDTYALLNDFDNVTGICPVQLAFRPSWSREPQGQLDDSRGIVRAENRFFRILADYFVNMVYGGKLFWGVRNPEERRPGVPYLANSPDAFIKSITPEIPSFQSFSVVDELNQKSRSAMVAPKSREGEVDLNKASAAFLQSAQGQLSDVVRSLQRQYAWAKQNANEAAFAQDEAFCNVEKTITGSARGRRFKTTYTPKKDIDGDYQNRVTYGTSSGLDPATHQIVELQKLTQNAQSVETFLENDPGTEDVPAELSRIRGEAVEQSVLQGLLLPTTPLDQRLRALAMFDEGKTPAEVAKALMEAAAPQPTAPIPGIPGTGAPAPEPTGNPFQPPEANAPPVLPPVAALQSVPRPG